MSETTGRRENQSNKKRDFARTNVTELTYMYICKDIVGFRVWGLGNRVTWLLGGSMCLKLT